MYVKEIPGKQWKAILEEFSSKHKKWLITLETDSNNLMESLAVNLPLDEIKLNDSGEHHDLEIILRNDSKEQVNYKIKDLKSLGVERDNIGADKALYFTSKEGVKTILRFNRTVLPEMLDGIV